MLAQVRKFIMTYLTHICIAIAREFFFWKKRNITYRETISGPAFSVDKDVVNKIKYSRNLKLGVLPTDLIY